MRKFLPVLADYRRSLDVELARLEKDSGFDLVLERLREARWKKPTVFLCSNKESAANANHLAAGLLFELNNHPSSIWKVVSRSAIRLLLLAGLNGNPKPPSHLKTLAPFHLSPSTSHQLQYLYPFKKSLI